ncbi:hypothetical protein [Nitratireductor sp. CH_MIT9313-5]|uniref:hypothetical protein n=1 Tax=Nitratireductor sp. CH_MIT9313-5 TaxID=3107764 RepID=UPI0030093AEF
MTKTTQATKGQPRHRRTRSVDILADGFYPAPATISPRLPLVLHSPTHSTERNQQWFDLTALKPFGGLAHQMANAFLRFISSRSTKTARGYLTPIRRVFGSVAKSYQIDWSPSNWERNFEAAARSVREDASLRAGTRNLYIANANAFAASLQAEGVLPSFRLPTGVTNAFLSATPKPAISQLAPRVAADSGALDAAFNDDKHSRETWELLTQLTNVTDPEVMKARLSTMLRHLRRLAEQGIRRHWTSHQQTMAAISRSEFEKVEAFLSASNGRLSRAAGFGKGSVSAFETEISLLSYIEYARGGILPTTNDDPQLTRLIYNRFSYRALDRRLHLTGDDSIYYLIIVLMETAMNVSSALSLTTSALVKVNEEDLYRLHWHKHRSGNEPLHDLFRRGDDSALSLSSSKHISLVNVIECLIRLQQRLSRSAIESEQDHLFLVSNLYGPRGSRGAYRVGVLNELVQNRAWHRIRHADPVLSAFPISLDQIRSSVLFMEALNSENNLVQVNARAKHKNYQTTVHYLRKVAATSLNHQQVREVQDFVFAHATERLPDLRERFVGTPERAKAIISKARRKGFGEWSAKPAEKGSDTTEAENVLVSWITSGTKILLAEPQVAAEIFAFRRHLRERSHARRYPASWTEVWGPVLLFLNAAWEAIPPDIKEEGEELAGQLQVLYMELD